MANNILYLIPARGGSKGIPNKNILPLAGKPLIYYTLDAISAIVPVENICVSTDSEAIKNVVETYGVAVPFLRPATLATDTSDSESVIHHALDYYKSHNRTFDYVMLLQPTSPLRKQKHVEDVLKMVNLDFDMIIAVAETKANPYYLLMEENEMGFLKKSKVGTFTRRQDCPPVYEINGALYLIKVDSLMQTKIGAFEKVVKYVMPAEESLDIDTPFDWKICGCIIEHNP